MSLGRTRRPRPVAAALVLGGVLGGVLAGCSGGGSDESAPDLLARAKTVLDDASSVHFVLDSENPPATGMALLGGEGDLARPSSFEGTLQVQAAGGSIDLEVVSVDGTVYAELPFTSGFGEVDPGQFGFGDPGALLDPETGISQLLAEAQEAELGEERRVDGEVVREVSAQLPGQLVADLLTSQDPEQDVDARFSVATGSGELRRAELTGPFFAADQNATFILELSDFGADVEITAPPVG